MSQDFGDALGGIVSSGQSLLTDVGIINSPSATNNPQAVQPTAGSGGASQASTPAGYLYTGSGQGTVNGAQGGAAPMNIPTWVWYAGAGLLGVVILVAVLKD